MVNIINIHNYNKNEEKEKQKKMKRSKPTKNTMVTYEYCFPFGFLNLKKFTLLIYSAMYLLKFYFSINLYI